MCYYPPTMGNAAPAPRTMTDDEIKIERILDGMQMARDFSYMRESNGFRSGSRQAGILRGLMFSAIYELSNKRHKKEAHGG